MIKPLGNFVLIKAKKIKNVSEGGIILQEDTTKKEQAVEQTGEIIAFGPTAFKRLRGCENPNWLEDGLAFRSSNNLNGDTFEAICDHFKWEDPDSPPHEQWGLKVGDTIEHRRYEAKDSVMSTEDEIYRFIPDIDILGVIDG